ncbi:hypothetical protein PHYBLDRAFT_143747 [Phycomyces blakesleeanus NRRL 1555(-)]|uniref:Uncharacterized protein n=1 Tax=Phycomyces blakesleeanus (strain ATCC 8743b / DSM 1359 / FGSC 10004 / NBRC 33097 / NRRL 1555) TaxID=763407 RepID=A0A167NAJ9_PHYB8|nr:hypothetical protein PHYBLDRAFT_143747 [Phycomyces blakesleeanus NRRL 1555(-)]OAD75500.1 hypothetical protein PHYBLDRAFT_143747 [Phycomyces blakesleeanus NRRL 1555(-)]|eukprot:XP_018293540.1 hypothetical protein PHYBLDRAFT_143747 [Phycomyces blakesleeanus NRRL 1555(-)]
MVFYFVHKDAVDEARIMPDTHGTVEKYRWILHCLRDAVFPSAKDSNSSTPLFPSVSITNNEQSLRNTITHAFPESKQFVPAIKEDKNGEKRGFLEKLAGYLDIFAFGEHCIDRKKITDAFLERYLYFGNCTSNCAESAQASLKHSLGTSSGKLKTVALKVKIWYEEFVDDCKRRLTVEYIRGSTNVALNKIKSASLTEIRYRISRYEIDKIKLKLSKSIIPENTKKRVPLAHPIQLLASLLPRTYQFDIIAIPCIQRR